MLLDRKYYKLDSMLRNIKPLVVRTRPVAQPRLLVQYNSPSVRQYAFSRFAERGPGSSRSRDRPERVPHPQQPNGPFQPEVEGTWHDVKAGQFTFRVWESSRTHAEDKPVFDENHTRSTPHEGPRSSHSEQDDSPLWQASRRSPSSDPEEGLTRLLMDNDLLIVTR